MFGAEPRTPFHHQRGGQPPLTEPPKRRPWPDYSIYTFAYLWVEAHILFQLRRYEDARAILEEVSERNPAFLVGHLTLAATYGHLGMLEEADWLKAEILTMSPEISAQAEGDSAPYREEEDRAHFVEGLRLAGIPD